MSIVEAALKLHGDAPSASSPQGTVDRKELAFVAMERTRMPMAVTDPRQPDNPIVLANKAFLEETGYSAEEVLGRNCRFLQGPATDPAVVAEVREAVRAGREITAEMLNYRKDGTPFWNQLYISPVYDDDGQLLYFFASQLDVTRRREAIRLKEAEHILLREVDHRAKNALALVQGIVRLSKRDEAESFADAVQGRVDALARAHTLLADGSWGDVSLDRIVRSEIASLDMTRIHIDGEAVEVAAAYVQPVALLLHELAANARRHGAFSVSQGSLAIEWRQDNSSRELSIRWIENGGPPPAAVREPGYGHTMIAAIAARQLRGTVRYAWEQCGLAAEVSILNVHPKVSRARATA